MKLFAVFQEGVYRHTCLGIFDSFQGAAKAADRAAEEDRDDYHSYDVFDFTLNAYDVEGDYIYSAKKGHAPTAPMRPSPLAGDPTKEGNGT